MVKTRMATPVRGAVLAALIWSAAAAPAAAYIDPTSAGAFLQSMYIIVVSGVIMIATLPHKVVAAYRAVRTKLGLGGPAAPATPTPTPTEEEPPSA